MKVNDTNKEVFFWMNFEKIQKLLTAKKNDKESVDQKE